MKKLSLLILMLSCLLITSVGCVTQGDTAYVIDRMSVVEKKLSKQQKQNSYLEKELRKKYTRQNNRVENIEDKLLRSEGRFEELDFFLKDHKELIAKLNSYTKSLHSAVVKLHAKIKNIESYTGYDVSDAVDIDGQLNEVSTVGTSQIGDKQVKTGTSSDDLELYNNAKTAFNSGKMDIARNLFQNVLKQYPGSDMADNAQFWIGESYYKDKKYGDAIIEYEKVVKNYPKGNKIAGAYLKQGFSFLALGEPSNAKILLNELIKYHPNSGEAHIARTKLKKIK